MDFSDGNSSGDRAPRAPSAAGSESWIMLEDAAPLSSRPSSRSSFAGVRAADAAAAAARGAASSPWEQFAHEVLPIRGTPDGLKAALDMGLEARFDSVAQAERSLSLAVQMEGFDADFLRRTSEAIEAMQRHPSWEEEEEEQPCGDEDAAAHSQDHDHDVQPREDGLKYGGRAPPFFGATAPRASPCGSPPLSVGLEWTPDCPAPPAPSPADDGHPHTFMRGERSDSAERRRQRREARARQEEKLATETSAASSSATVSATTLWSRFWGAVTLPLVLSHLCTLVLGFVAGRAATDLWRKTAIA